VVRILRARGGSCYRKEIQENRRLFDEVTFTDDESHLDFFPGNLLETINPPRRMATRPVRVISKMPNFSMSSIKASTLR
jgi:hypothetical protein